MSRISWIPWLVLAVGTAGAQARTDVAGLLMQDAAVRDALQRALDNEPQTLADQIRLCEVAAPPFKEARRGELFRQMLEDVGVTGVRTDDVGNVIGDRPGLARRPRLVFSAHLDTVFPEGTEVGTSRQGNVIRGPGIADNCRGLAVVIAVVRALNQADVRTPGTITFVGTVGEEGLGDLRGVRHLFENSLKGQIDKFVSVDGSGLGITHVAVGSSRYRVVYSGPGGHSFGSFGMANPIHALGRAIAQISDFQVPGIPKTTFNVGRIGGGTSVNSISFEAWMEIDIRSSDSAALSEVEDRFRKAVDKALKDENARWGQRGKLGVHAELTGRRPSGLTPESSPIVRTALSVSRALSLPSSLGEGSTDSNVPISMNIPAITIGGGGQGYGAHSPGEYFDSTNSAKGTQRATLLAIALAQD